MREFREEDVERDEQGRFCEQNGYGADSADLTSLEMSIFPDVEKETKQKFGFRTLTKEESRDIIKAVPREAYGFSQVREDTKHHLRHVKEMGFKSQKSTYAQELRFETIRQAFCFTASLEKLIADTMRRQRPSSL